MFGKNNTELENLGASITSREIKQQPSLWEETYSIYQENKEEINAYLSSILEKHDKVQIIFSGAGTSAYVGDTTKPFVKEQLDPNKWDVQSFATTSIVSNPYQYLDKNTPTLLVSFARSGNSPESVATVNLAKEIVDDLYQLTITCSSDGKLAKASEGDSKNLLILMPEKSNDQGFAMTGSYTCMTLTTLLIFSDFNTETEKSYINQIVHLGEEVLNHSEDIAEFLNDDFKRIIYLGSGIFEGLAREAQLKVLELTAGKIVTAFDSSLGFRHGPKSFVDKNTLVFLFVSNNPYTRRYDIDMLNELKADDIAQRTVAVQVDGGNKFVGNSFDFNNSGTILPDVFLALPYVIFAQIVSLSTSVKLGNKPDDPSPTGTVNRVVKGVTIHDYDY